MRRHKGDCGNPKIGSQRIEGAARKVEYLLNPEHQLKAGSNQKQDGGMEQTAQHDIEPRCQ